jgi:Tol biopolymer transport system component
MSNPSVSPDAKFVAFVESHENWNIWRVQLKGEEIGTPQRFLASTGQNHSPSFSSDGRTIAFVSDRSGNPEIWLCDNDSQHLRQLTHFGGPWLGTIRWSLDSNSIVFDARPKGHSAIYRMAVNQGKPNWLRINHSKLGVHLGRATADTSTSIPHVAEHQRFGDAT